MQTTSRIEGDGDDEVETETEVDGDASGSNDATNSVAPRSATPAHSTFAVRVRGYC